MQNVFFKTAYHQYVWESSWLARNIQYLNGCLWITRCTNSMHLCSISIKTKIHLYQTTILEGFWVVVLPMSSDKWEVIKILEDYDCTDDEEVACLKTTVGIFLGSWSACLIHVHIYHLCECGSYCPSLVRSIITLSDPEFVVFCIIIASICYVT